MILQAVAVLGSFVFFLLLVCNPSIPVIGCTAVGIRSKTIERIELQDENMIFYCRVYPYFSNPYSNHPYFYNRTSLHI